MYTTCLFCTRPLGTNEVLERQLPELERAWREAEEIGAIADSLLLPSWIDETIKRFRSPHA